MDPAARFRARDWFPQGFCPLPQAAVKHETGGMISSDFEIKEIATAGSAGCCSDLTPETSILQDIFCCPSSPPFLPDQPAGSWGDVSRGAAADDQKKLLCPHGWHVWRQPVQRTACAC